MSRGLDDRSKKFIDAVQADLRALSNETRRKFQPVKEVIFLFEGLGYILFVPETSWIKTKVLENCSLGGKLTKILV